MLEGVLTKEMAWQCVLAGSFLLMLRRDVKVDSHSKTTLTL
jgi:hypothetical protein